MERNCSWGRKKIHKKKENKAFDFCIMQFSQSYCSYQTVYVFTEVSRIQGERKRSNETYSFVWKCDRSNRRCKGGDYHFLVILIKIFVLPQTLSSGLILTSPEILGLSSDGFCSDPFSVSLDLSSLIFFDLISTPLWAQHPAYINWGGVLATCGQAHA